MNKRAGLVSISILLKMLAVLVGALLLTGPLASAKLNQLQICTHVVEGFQVRYDILNEPDSLQVNTLFSLSVSHHVFLSIQDESSIIFSFL